MTPAAVPSLTAAQTARAHYLAQRLYGGESLGDFILRLSPHHPPPRHFRPLLERLQHAPQQPVNVCLSMPPRHGKTTLIQHAVPWWLSRFPGDTCAYASYSDRQAWSKSRVMRELAEKAGVRLAADAANLAEWRTTAGGGLLSVGAGSGLTGQGVSGLMVVDDPFKNPEEAQSRVIRDKIGEWFDGVVDTRIEGASTFVIHTRWHEDDLIGRLAKDKFFEVINLPALAEDNDPLGRAEGEPLWPERGGRFSKAGLERRRDRNAFLFAALYQGRPRPKGNKVFGAPHYYDPKTFNPQGCVIMLFADPAATAKTSSDFCAAVALYVTGRTPETATYYVREVYRHQVQTPQFADELVSFQSRHGNAEVLVEAVGAFKAIPQMMRRARPGIRVREINITSGDKHLRAQPAASAWNSGKILVPLEAPWLKDFLDEIADFTGINDRHDDQVDALSGAFNNVKLGASYTPLKIGSAR